MLRNVAEAQKLKVKSKKSCLVIMFKDVFNISMGRRLRTLICAMFFCVFNSIVILMRYTKIYDQSRNK